VGALFENKIAAMVGAIERFTLQKQLTASFSQWRNHVQMTQLAQAAQENNKQELLLINS